MQKIPGFPNYSITKGGSVYSHILNRWLKSSKRQNGYLQIELYQNGKRFGKKIHRLVLETFIGPCPQGMETRHLNNCRTDNRLKNLCWGTRSENTLDAVQCGTASGLKKRKWTPDYVAFIRYVWKSEIFTLTQIARWLKMNRRTIYDICHYKTYRKVGPL